MGYLRTEDFQFVKGQILEGHLDELVARKIISPDPGVSAGSQEAKRWKYNIPEETAEHIPKGGPYPTMKPSQTPATVPIHKIGLAAEIDEWDLESAKSLGQFALDKKAAQDIGRKIAEYEDSYIFKGDSSINVTGLYDIAGNTKACTTQWDQPGAEPYEDVNEAAGKLEADGFTPKFLILNKNDFFLLRQEDAYGNVYMKKVLDNLSISANNVLKTATLISGTALLCDAGANISELKIAEDIKVLPAEQQGDTITIRAREKLGLDVYEPNAYCAISNIT